SVNVKATIDAGSTPSSMSADTRREIASVLPAPAQAMTCSWPPRWSMTLFCSPDGVDVEADVDVGIVAPLDPKRRWRKVLRGRIRPRPPGSKQKVPPGPGAARPAPAARHTLRYRCPGTPGRPQPLPAVPRQHEPVWNRLLDCCTLLGTGRR